MPIEVPKESKTATTIYHDFKGVDLTNDPSNVWYRRSPNGVNMLPDASGRPFKRTGWDKIITSDILANKYHTDTGNATPEEVQINKLYYFELHGLDHMFIFANIGVFIYRKTDDGEEYLDTSSAYSYDSDIIDSYNRAYFFEGDGEAAFYIYGNLKVWRYRWTDAGFSFEEIQPYIPTVNISVDAKHESGTMHEGVNLLSGYVKETFQDNAYRTASVTSTGVGFTASIGDEGIVVTRLASTTTFTYKNGEWQIGGDSVLIKDYGIVVTGTPEDGDTVTVNITTANKIRLPSVFDSNTGFTVKASSALQFDTTLEFTTAAPSPGQVKLDGDMLIFGDAWRQLVEGEDCIEVTIPRNTRTPSNHKVTERLTVQAGG